MASATISDLIEHFKLETEFHQEHTVEITHALQHDRGRQRVKTETIWTRRENLGSGAFGTVWLEKNQSGATRAVKKVSKTPFDRIGIDYHVELLALAKLSKVCDGPHTDKRYAKINSTKTCLSSSTV
jgi:hypothetical protein